MAIVRASLPFWALLATAHAVPQPMITPAPILPRDFSPSDFYHSVISGIGDGYSDVKSYVVSGVPQYFQDLPTGDKVKKELGINDDDLKAKPTQVLNLPAYANWTDEGWNVRIHGNVFKQPEIKQEKVDDLANVFLIGTDIEDLPPSQQEQARNVTKSIFVVQQGDVNVTVNFQNDVSIRPDASGGVVNAQGGIQSFQMPYPTTPQGDFDAFVKLANTTGPDGGYMMAGNATSSIQSLNMYVNGTDTGNATAYLVPPKGLTIVSDIDDILRITKIYLPKEGLLNSFARPFTPWMSMPEIYSNWSAKIPDFHFHYLTTTPEQVTRNYMEYIFKTYPLGSFDTRPLNFSDVEATLSIRRTMLDKIFQTFPQRKFILMGDTTNSDVMKAYPALAKDYPGQVQCIFLRNVTATDEKDLFPYDTSGFEGLDQKQFMFFNVAEDLTDLDIVNGNCHNASIKQNVTYGFQGRGWGNSAGRAVLGSSWVLIWALCWGLISWSM